MVTITVDLTVVTVVVMGGLVIYFIVQVVLRHQEWERTVRVFVAVALIAVVIVLIVGVTMQEQAALMIGAAYFAS